MWAECCTSGVLVYFIPVQWGVGKAIANAERVPVVLPMYAWGNNAILPQARDNNLLPEVCPSRGALMRERFQFCNFRCCSRPLNFSAGRHTHITGTRPPVIKAGHSVGGRLR